LKLHVKYFEKKLGELPDEKLWEIIEESLLPYPNEFNKRSMSRDEVLELAVMLKASNELFRNLEQVALLKHELDQASYQIK
jgi:hypothetical protein